LLQLKWEQLFLDFVLWISGTICRNIWRLQIRSISSFFKNRFDKHCLHLHFCTDIEDLLKKRWWWCVHDDQSTGYQPTEDWWWWWWWWNLAVSCKMYWLLHQCKSWGASAPFAPPSRATEYTWQFNVAVTRWTRLSINAVALHSARLAVGWWLPSLRNQPPRPAFHNSGVGK